MWVRRFLQSVGIVDVVLLCNEIGFVYAFV